MTWIHHFIGFNSQINIHQPLSSWLIITIWNYIIYRIFWHFGKDGCHKFSLMMYYCAQWIKDIQVYRLVLLLFIVHSRRLNALLNSLIKRKDCWSGELKSKCPLLLRHYEGLFVLKSLIYTQAQCKLDFWLAVMRRRTVAFTQRTVGLQKDCSVRDFKNATGIAN